MERMWWSWYRNVSSYLFIHKIPCRKTNFVYFFIYFVRAWEDEENFIQTYPTIRDCNLKAQTELFTRFEIEDMAINLAKERVVEYLEAAAETRLWRLLRVARSSSMTVSKTEWMERAWEWEAWRREREKR